MASSVIGILSRTQFLVNMIKSLSFDPLRKREFGGTTITPTSRELPKNSEPAASRKMADTNKRTGFPSRPCAWV